jgi:hypothetical protein
MLKTSNLDLFAGIAVADFAKTMPWYEQLFACAPALCPYETEAVWEVAPHRYVYIVQQPENACHARHTLFVDDFDSVVGQIRSRGIEPSKQGSYANGVRKVSYRDRNEIAFGGTSS